jgi:hypothetical protein
MTGWRGEAAQAFGGYWPDCDAGLEVLRLEAATNNTKCDAASRGDRGRQG